MKGYTIFLNGSLAGILSGLALYARVKWYEYVFILFFCVFFIGMMTAIVEPTPAKDGKNDRLAQKKGGIE